jgi:hypothetical protein
MTFEDDFRWQKKFKSHYQRIVRQVARVDEGTWEDDVYRATDMLMFATPQLAFACRARSSWYRDRFGDEFTIRLARPSGAPTELAKICRGHGDFLIYGFEAEPGARHLNPWLLINLPLFREYMDNGGRWYERRNKQENEYDQASSFAVFDVNEVAQTLGLINNSQGIDIRPWPSASGICRVCGHPSWQQDDYGPVHRCCAWISPRADCLACKVSRVDQRTRWGWPNA